MTTFEALGEQFGLHKKVLYNYIIAVVAVSLVLAAVIVAVAKISDSSNKPISIDNSEVTSQPITFPAASQACLQGCQALRYQGQAMNLQTQPAIIQTAANVMNY